MYESQFFTHPRYIYILKRLFINPNEAQVEVQLKRKEVLLPPRSRVTLHSPVGCPFSNQFLLEAITKVTVSDRIHFLKILPSFYTFFHIHDFSVLLVLQCFDFPTLASKE